jgi:NAD dependent epimerase/dehydratase family enzyme
MSFLALWRSAIDSSDSASGFIGFPAAQALVRAGHNVYGLTRSAQKAKQLIAEESGSPTIYSSYQQF